MSGSLNTVITGRVNGDTSMDIVACRLPTTELKFHNLSSLVAYVGFGRPPSFVLARKDKHKN